MTLFQKPRAVGKTFDLHEVESDRVHWYDNQSSSSSCIGAAVPYLCKLTRVPTVSNRNVRATGVQMLGELDYDSLIGSTDGSGLISSADECKEEYPDSEDDLDSFEYKETKVETKQDLGPLIQEVVDQEMSMDH